MGRTGLDGSEPFPIGSGYEDDISLGTLNLSAGNYWVVLTDAIVPRAGAGSEWINSTNSGGWQMENPPNGTWEMRTTRRL